MYSCSLNIELALRGMYDGMIRETGKKKLVSRVEMQKERFDYRFVIDI